MTLLVSGLHTSSIFAAAAMILGAAIASRPVLADSLQEAIEAVNKTSDDALLDELQRRHEARRDIPATLDKSAKGREIKTGLSKFEDATFDKAVRTVKANGRVIYGPDDRKDWYQIKDKTIKRLASASAAMFKAADLEPGPSGSVKLKTSTLAESYELCAGEAFEHQVTGAFCSATLIKDNIVLTAGHCVREISNDSKIPYTNRVNFIFGFHVKAEESPGDTELPDTQIFSGKQVLAGELSGTNNRDWALVELDRSVPKVIAEPVVGWRTDDVIKDQGVFVIGYPSGLPLKYAPNADIRDVSAPAFFVANLDTFGGNSGSGVYDETTYELVGVLVRGETDYGLDEAANCARVNHCPTSGCRGEDVTRISLVPKP